MMLVLERSSQACVFADSGYSPRVVSQNDFQPGVIEEAGDEILDFSERNPFGEYGQVTGEF